MKEKLPNSSAVEGKEKERRRVRDHTTVTVTVAGKDKIVERGSI